jgi:predicted aspartyl protease
MQTAWLAAIVGALSLAAGSAAQQPAVPAAPAAPADPNIEVTETLDLDVDRTLRMTVPVSIAGQGPYGFIVDTGAQRTVISRELADRLGLDPGRAAMMFSMTEASRIETVVIPALMVGQRTIPEIHAPALARRDLGAEGMLGVDSLRSQRVELDFQREEMTVTPSRLRPERPWPRDTILITARSRYGHLIITDATFDGQRIVVIVDTGAQISVANSALRRRLERRGRLSALRPIELVSVTGGRLEAEYGFARRVQLGNALIRNLPVAFADVHPFRQLRLTGRPAILLGMDALQLFDRVSIDFANRRVRLLVRDSSELARDLRMAGAGQVRPEEAPPAAS